MHDAGVYEFSKFPARERTTEVVRARVLDGRVFSF